MRIIAILLCFIATCHTSHIFVTLLSDDTYLPGVMALIESAAIVCHDTPCVPFYVLCVREAVSSRTIGVLKEYGELRNLHVVMIDGVRRDLAECKTTIQGPPRFENTFSKIRIFDPSNYPNNTARAVYLDADTLVVGSCITDLFSARRFTPPAFAPDIAPPDKFNTGVILFQPDGHLYSELMRYALGYSEGCAKMASSYDGGDQGMFNAFFDHEWTGLNGHHDGWSAKHRLSSRYDAMLQLAMINPSIWRKMEPELCVVHFAGTAIKPFAPPNNPSAIKIAKSSVFLMAYHKMWHKIYGSINVQTKPRVDLLQ